MRCGSEDDQCVRTEDMCNGVKNCRNGWDESVEECVDETQRNMFVTEGKKESLRKFVCNLPMFDALRALVSSERIDEGIWQLCGELDAE